MKQNIQQLSSRYSLNTEATTKNFGEATVDRGIHYFTQERVLRINKITELNEGSLAVDGNVRGKSDYKTRLIFREYKGQKTPFSYCNCPVGNNCKHGIALLYYFINQQVGDQIETPVLEEDYDDSIEVDKWLNALAASENTLDDSEDEDDDLFEIQYHIVYELHYENEASSEVIVKPHKVRLLKKGGYGKAEEVSSHDIGSYGSATLLVTEEDRTILRVIKGESQRQYYTSSVITSCKIRGQLGHFLLNALLKTKRLFWLDYHSSTQALKIGELRPILFEWQEDDGYYELDPKTQPAVDNFFLLDNLFYVDTERGECGVAKHESLSSQQILNFLAVPSIPKTQVQKVSEQLIKVLPDVDVPLPMDLGFETVDVTEIVPSPHLKLSSTTVMRRSGIEKRLHIASLRFDYDHLNYQPCSLAALESDIAVLLQDNVRYRIHRDKQQEKTALDYLCGLGFTGMRQKGKAYRPLELCFNDDDIESIVARWDIFQEETVPELQSQGWNIQIDESFALQIEVADEWHAELETEKNGDWFEMSLGFEIKGKRVNLLPLLVDLLIQADSPEALRQSLQEKPYYLFQYSEHHWIKLSTQRMLGILDTIVELYEKNILTNKGNLKFSRYAGLHYHELLNNSNLQWKGAEELQRLNKKIRNFSGIESVALPKGLKAELRDYQKQGVNWLQFLQNYQFNGVLADDMGLGKTVQTLAHLLIEHESGRAENPNLVIAPTSLMSNWRNEAQRFTPQLKVLVLQGVDRKQYFDNLDDYDIVLTTYPLILRDQEVYAKRKFHYLILDEAQAIKNAKSKTTQAIYALNAQHRLCLTGTPLENHLGEIWSMYHFLMPGYLGPYERFNRLFRNPIEKLNNAQRGAQLRQRVKPFMLRRRKEFVAKELPKKTEIIRTVPLVGSQRDLYETVRLAMDKKLNEEINRKGLSRSHIMILEALLKLRQVCCDPRLVKLDQAKRVKHSAKLDLLMTLLPEMVEEGRKILIFSQFVSMLELIEKELKQKSISYSMLTGKTQKREAAIDAFQAGDAAVFLISLKAGGVGLNLTAADTVIHYDPWWNPAVERQATDRAYRIGQDKPIFVYKLLTEDTVEEKILQLQEKKQLLADSLYGDTEKQASSFNQEDLSSLLKPLD